MDLPLNQDEPTLMHIDLNSCFATVEQQAHLSFRGRPLVVAAYASNNGCVLSPSIEAKKLGMKVGMTVRDAKLIYRNVIVCTPDPVKYRAVYQELMKLFSQYSPRVTPKSIDEAVLDFSQTQALFKRSLVEIGLEIKKRMRSEIGDFLSCNVGLGTNRFLAKTAASLHKPDGLDVITYKNLHEVFFGLTLLDLCGINTRYNARLNAAGICTPLEFLDAPLTVLQHQVFQSIVGYYWYLRLRGWEIDAIDFERKSFGHEYALGEKTADPKILSRLLMKLCEKMGRRLRESKKFAFGVHLGLIYTDKTSWHHAQTFQTKLYSTTDLFKKALLIFNQQPQKKVVAHLSISCFGFSPLETVQLDLFSQEETKKKELTKAVDEINDKYGEFTLTPALMMNTKNVVVDRIAFGR